MCRFITVTFRNQVWKRKEAHLNGEAFGLPFSHISVLKTLSHCIIVALLETSMGLKVNRARVSPTGGPATLTLSSVGLAGLEQLSAIVVVAVAIVGTAGTA